MSEEQMRRIIGDVRKYLLNREFDERYLSQVVKNCALYSGVREPEKQYEIIERMKKEGIIRKDPQTNLYRVY